VSIRTLQRAAEMQARSAEQALLNAKFVRRELLARRAHILSLLLAVPSELARQPAVQLLTTAYWQRLLFLLEQPRMTNAGDELEFAGRLRLRFEEVFPLIAPAL
jgi:NAD-dependent oxidoreductase involved in siderophore biosynthesis